MSAPKLVLLTGPAAGEVARVFRCGIQDVPGPPGCVWWDEVRDYWEAPRCIAGVPDAVAIEHGIRETPGGEAWLVGLGLPPRPVALAEHADWAMFHSSIWDSYYPGLPARLAILAPEPPALLVERVRQWGGESWRCSNDSEQEWPQIECVDWSHPTVVAKTWTEAVRIALGGANA